MVDLFPSRKQCSWHRQVLFLTDNGEWWEERESQRGFRKSRRNLGDFALDLYLTNSFRVGSVDIGQVTGQGLCMGTSMPCSGHAIGRTIRVRYLKLWRQAGWICFPMGESFSSPSITLYRTRMQHKAGEWRDIAELGSAALVPVPIDVHTHFAALLKGSGSYPLGTRYFHFKMSNPEDDT